MIEKINFKNVQMEVGLANIINVLDLLSFAHALTYLFAWPFVEQIMSVKTHQVNWLHFCKNDCLVSVRFSARFFYSFCF